MTERYQLFKNLETSSVIYGPSYYQTLPNKFKVETFKHGEVIEESVSLFESVKDKYMALMRETFLKTMELPFDMGCSYDYSFNILTIPIFWQDIVVLIYMSLCLHRYVTDNSRVIAIGESPLKLVFIQQVLNMMPELNEIFKKNKMASNNIDYTYFPISGLGSYINTRFWTRKSDDSNIFTVKKDITFNLNYFIDNMKSIREKFNTQIFDHFKLFNLDPRYIIANKNIYFEDRMEGYKTLIILICFYDQMCVIQNLTPDERQQFYKKLYFIGFDSKSVEKTENDRIIIDRINKFLYKTITNQDPPEKIEEPHFIQRNFDPIKNEELDNDDDYCGKENFNIFSNQRDLHFKMFTFLTIPENTNNKSRCAKSCDMRWPDCPLDIQTKFNTTNEFQLKDTTENVGENCNIMNLFIMLLINELGPAYISNIITNLDNINDDIFINSMDFTEINRQILAFMNEQKLVYNNNIIHNIKHTRIITRDVYEKMEEFILKNGLFSKCTYQLPLKISEGGRRSNGSRRSNSSSRRSNSSSSISNSSRRSNSRNRITAL